MKKILMTALAAATLFCASAAVPDYDQAAMLEKAKTDVQNWMSYLPDDVYVAHVSIPGTHDTATAEGWETTSGSTNSTTQSMKVDDQLLRGVRAFDIRPGLRNGEIYCNHGIDRTKLKFDDCLKKFTDYLTAHPTEFFVIHFFRGNVYISGSKPSGTDISAALGITDKAYDDEASQRQYDELLGNMLNPGGTYADFVVDYSPTLKVKDVRGKMILFRRDRIDFVNLKSAGNLSNWPQDTADWKATEYVTAINASNPFVFGKIHVTDISSPENEKFLNRELSSITNLFKFNCAQTRPNDAKRVDSSYKPEWSMIFTSGAYGGENTSGYKKNAAQTNPHLVSLLQDEANVGPTGIVFSDWVFDSNSGAGSEIVTEIYQNNFRYIADFILDDELFDSSGEEPVENIFDETKWYYMRNVATGQLLSGGYWWGTHAALNNAGMKVQPRVNVENGSYCFLTDRINGNSQNVLGDNDYVDNNGGVGSAKQFKMVRLGENRFVFMSNDGTTALGAQYRKCYGSDYQVLSVNTNVNDPMQQWELYECDEYYENDLARLPLKDGIDITYKIGAFAGNCPDNDSWKVSNAGKNLTCSKVETNGSEGTALFSFRNGKKGLTSNKTQWTLTKEINNLPNGVYKLSFDACMYNDGDIKVSVKSGGASQDIQLPNAGGSGTESLDDARAAMLSGAYNHSFDVTVTDGAISFQAVENTNHGSATANYFGNFKLIYFGTEEQYEKSKLFVVQDAIDKATEVVCSLPEEYRDGWVDAIAPYQEKMDNFAIEGDGSAEIAEIYALMQRYVLAQKEAGADLTSAVLNNSFETGTLTGWNVSEIKGDTGVKDNSNDTYHVDNADGSYVYNTYDGETWGAEVSQTLSGLHAGVYRLEALLTSGEDAQVQLFANDETVNITAVAKTRFENAVVEFAITEDEAELVIGARMVDHWYKADNFRLSFVAPFEALEVPVKEVVGKTQLVEGETYYIAARHDEKGLHVMSASDHGYQAIADENDMISHMAQPRVYTLAKDGADYVLNPVAGAGVAASPLAVADARLKVAVEDGVEVAVTDENGNRLGFHPGERTFGFTDAHTTPAMLYSAAEGDETETGVDDVLSDTGGEPVYYNLQGMRVDNPAPGLYIRKQGGKACKVLVK